MGHFCRPNEFKGIWEFYILNCSHQIIPSQISPSLFFILELWSQWKRFAWLRVHPLKPCYSYDEDMALMLHSELPLQEMKLSLNTTNRTFWLSHVTLICLLIILPYHYFSSINHWCFPHSCKFVIFTVTISFTSPKCRSVARVFVTAHLQAFLL